VTEIGKEVKDLEWQTINVLGTEVEFHQVGTGQPLVLIDGSLAFRPDGPFMGDLPNQYRVICVRFPGFGDKVLPGWISSVDDYAYLGNQLIRELDLSQAILMGTSLGGWIAVEMAAMDSSKLSCLFLVDAFGLKSGPMDRLDVPDIFAMPRAALESLLYADPGNLRYDQSAGDDKTLERMARGWETMALISWDTFFHNPKLQYRLAGIHLPTLLLRGAADGLVSRQNSRAFTSLIKGAKLEEIENSGHFPMIEKPREASSRIATFASMIKGRT
jgi:pimeloyl-ACP methyl ester carboxylesterase